ncbi:NAD(P)H-dependent oxidoreductase subunit E [Ancylomarina longa]|uniref:(2Fe-2S) ferredoxin domain-containing protein n=1 Tax=Ancylomarina longa TaxID=2487017 RepID=A0A434AXG7_9BACT|nr:NAD(P)H-dependent oxidoreductase subunit E [Ancylomarina longa]RUT79108.1 (2Fe-2S) ferredoxin domain-containing protein [Ancylomarina longa]
MSDKIEITICLGSSCFSRGNGKTLKAINTFLEENKLKDQVFFHGELCTGNCAKGPILKINEDLYEEIDPEKVNEILNGVFGLV